MRAHAAARRADATSAGRRLRGTGAPRTAADARAQRRLGMDQRHGVLQLVAEAEGAARLVVAAARPQAAGQGLVEQPAVGQHIERRIGGFHLHRAQRAVPVLPDRFQRARAAVRRRGSAAPACWRIGAASPADAEPEDDFALLPVGQFERAPGSRAQGSRPAPTLPDRRARVMRRRVAQGAVAAEEFGAVAADRLRVGIVRRRRRRRGRRTRCCRDCARQSAPLAGSISVMTCMADLGRRSPSTHST